jgi:hypothetical protein
MKSTSNFFANHPGGQLPRLPPPGYATAYRPQFIFFVYYFHAPKDLPVTQQCQSSVIPTKLKCCCMVNWSIVYITIKPVYLAYLCTEGSINEATVG